MLFKEKECRLKTKKLDIHLEKNKFKESKITKMNVK